MGTLAAVLAGKKIRTFKDLFKATVSGDIENVEGVLKITRIHVHYTLKAGEDKRETVMEALNSYITMCPAAQSVISAINISHDISLEPMPA